MQRRETGRAIHCDPALWPQGQRARLRMRRRCIAVAGAALLVLSGNVAVSGTSAATLTSTPTHNTRDVRGYSTGTPVAVVVNATETATATVAVTAVSTTSTPTTATPVITTAVTTMTTSATTATTVTNVTTATVVTAATRTFVAQPLIIPDATPAHITATPPPPTTTTITHPVTTAPASTSGAGTAVIQPILPAGASSPAGTNAASTTATATALRTPNAITSSASAMRTTTPPATGTVNATNGAKASLIPAATATITVTATARPPRNSGLALLGPPMTIAATAEDIANGGSVVIARVALRHLGEFSRPDGVPWFGWCEMFVGNIADEAGMFHTRFPSALTDSYAATLFRGRAPAGSLVFFDQRSDLYGHVGIALGDGTMISALGPGITRTAYEQWGSYIGWRPYPGLGTGHATAKAATVMVHAAIPEALSPAPSRGREDGEHTQPEALSPAPSQDDEDSGYATDEYAINEIAPCQTP